MSKARPRAKVRKKDIHLELLPGQKVKLMNKPKAGERSMKTVREVLRGAGILRRLFKKQKK